MIEYAPQMLLDCSGHLFDRSQATADSPGIPVLTALLRPDAPDIMPELHTQRLDRPDSYGFQSTGSQHPERTLPRAREVSQLG